LLGQRKRLFPNETDYLSEDSLNDENKIQSLFLSECRTVFILKNKVNLRFSVFAKKKRQTYFSEFNFWVMPRFC